MLIVAWRLGLMVVAVRPLSHIKPGRRRCLYQPTRTFITQEPLNCLLIELICDNWFMQWQEFPRHRGLLRRLPRRQGLPALRGRKQLIRR